MTLILTVGDWASRSEYLVHLVEAGYLVGWSSQGGEGAHPVPGMRAAGLVCALDSDADAGTAASVASALRLPWLAWDCAGGAYMAAYRLGAAAVLPLGISPADFVQTIAMFLSDAEASGTFSEGGESRVYQPPEIIAVGTDSVVAVRSGIMAARTLHPGGAEVLMGLFGPGEIILAHPSDLGFLELVAHTDLEISVHPWQDVALTWEFARRTRQSQGHLTAWACVQSRTRVDHRVLGILMLLAERFGQRMEPDWTVIDVRLTHQQLADASCATRPTVSKVLRELLPRGVLGFDGAGDDRRIYLRLGLAMEIMSC